jgi:hypothetical protein
MRLVSCILGSFAMFAPIQNAAVFFKVRSQCCLYEVLYSRFFEDFYVKY